jgi:hypothetical protein
MDLSVVTVGINPDKWNKVFAGLAVGVRYCRVVVSSQNGSRMAEL